MTGDPREIRVYLDNGLVYRYPVRSAEAAREHAAAIACTGYRHNDGKGEFVHYPPHRIVKIAVVGGPVFTSYPDSVEGT